MLIVRLNFALLVRPIAHIATVDWWMLEQPVSFRAEQAGIALLVAPTFIFVALTDRGQFRLVGQSDQVTDRIGYALVELLRGHTFGHSLDGW